MLTTPESVAGGLGLGRGRRGAAAVDGETFAFGTVGIAVASTPAIRTLGAYFWPNYFNTGIVLVEAIILYKL